MSNAEQWNGLEPISGSRHTRVRRETIRKSVPKCSKCSITEPEPPEFDPASTFDVRLSFPKASDPQENIRRLREFLKTTWRRYGIRCTAVAPAERDVLQGKIYKAEKKKEGGSGRNQHSEEHGQNVQVPNPTAKKLAAEFGVNERTVRRNAEFAEDVDRCTPAGGSTDA